MYNQASGRQLKPGIIRNEHISNDTKIAESKLQIDWSARGDDILEKKLVVDYVQVTDKSVSAGVDKVSVTAQISSLPSTNDSTKGVVVQNGKNKVILRDAGTGDPVISSDGTEVYGKLTHDGTNYILSFFYKNLSGVETAFSYASNSVIDFQFPQRFSLLEVAENFASNEKFVDGASDVSARLDLTQIAKDVFGSGYTYDQDGSANRSKSLIDELLNETSGVTNTTVRAKTIIDEIVIARGAEATVGARLTKAESATSANATTISGVKTEVENARGGEASVSARLEKIDTKDAAQDTAIAGLETLTSTHTTAIENLDGAKEEHASQISAVESELEEARGDKDSLSLKLAEIVDAITTEVTNREAAGTKIVEDLAATSIAKGASLIGVHDANEVFTGTTVEAVLSELEARLSDVELTGGEEVKEARTSNITGEHGSLDVRLETAEARYEAVKEEVELARGTSATVNERIATAEQGLTATAEELSAYKTANDASVSAIEETIGTHDDRLQDVEAVAHRHFAEDKQITEGDALIGASSYNLTSGTFVAGDKSLQVFVNGMLQMDGIHYTELVNATGEGTGVSFAPELLMEGDVIQFRWTK